MKKNSNGVPVKLSPVDRRPVEQLDFIGALSIIVGSILGSGIFIAPGLIAAFSPNLTLTFAFWIVGGLVCAIGAAIYGSLGLRFPQGGGQYVYLRESLGTKYSRFYAWASIAVICPTMLAGTALFFASQWEIFFPLHPGLVKAIAVFVVMFFTYLNTRGIHLAGNVQKALVLAHVALFLGVIFFSAQRLPNHELVNYPAFTGFGGLSFSKGIVALAAVLWSFEGFNSVTFITNEIRGGERNVRKIALVGCGVVLALYLLFNLVALNGTSPTALAHSPNVAASLMSQAFGLRGGLWVFALTLLGLATVLHTSVIIGPRIISATARDGLVWGGLSRLSGEHSAPKNALWFQFGIVLLYVFVGHFESLITCFIVLNWLFYGLTVTGYLKVRGAGIRPIERAGAYFFICMVVFLLGSQFIENPGLAAAGVVVFAIGVYGADPLARAFSRARNADRLRMATGVARPDEATPVAIGRVRA